jgi:hypothetical protein
MIDESNDRFPTTLYHERWVWSTTYEERVSVSVYFQWQTRLNQSPKVMRGPCWPLGCSGDFWSVSMASIVVQRFEIVDTITVAIS